MGNNEGNNNDSTVNLNLFCSAENSMTEYVCNSSNNTIPDYPYNLQGDPHSSRNSPRNFNHPTTSISTSSDTGTPVRNYNETNQQLSYTPNGNDNSDNNNMQLEGGDQNAGNKRTFLKLILVMMT